MTYKTHRRRRGAGRFPLLLAVSARLGPGAQAEAADQQECALGKGAAGGEQAELDRRVVEVEEAARAAHPSVLELQVVESLDDDEAAARGDSGYRSPVGAEQPPRDAREAAAVKLGTLMAERGLVHTVA